MVKTAFAQMYSANVLKINYNLIFHLLLLDATKSLHYCKAAITSTAIWAFILALLNTCHISNTKLATKLKFCALVGKN
jgi:hypothetical protein